MKKKKTRRTGEVVGFFRRGTTRCEGYLTLGAWTFFYNYQGKNNTGQKKKVLGRVETFFVLFHIQVAEEEETNGAVGCETARTVDLVYDKMMKKGWTMEATRELDFDR